jgi:hypothetical protein
VAAVDTAMEQQREALQAAWLLRSSVSDQGALAERIRTVLESACQAVLARLYPA